MEPQRKPHDHRGNGGWWWKLDDYGYPTVHRYRPDDTWAPVEGHPVLLDAIYEVGYEEGGDSVMNDYSVGRWAKKVCNCGMEGTPNPHGSHCPAF